MQQNVGFKEFNAQSYVAITRFRDSVAIFLVNEKYEDTPQKAVANIHNNVTETKKKKVRLKDLPFEKKTGKRAKDKRLDIIAKENFHA